LDDDDDDDDDDDAELTNIQFNYFILQSQENKYSVK